MGDLLLSARGRINTQQFYRGGFILILLSIALGLITLVSPAIGKTLSLVNIVLIYCWAAIWIKRLHNGGKYGWMFLAYVLLYSVISLVLASIMLMFVGGEEFMRIVLEKASETITDEQFQARAEAWSIKHMVPMLITKSLASILTLYIGDKTIPVDAGDNQYGAGDTFD